MLTVQEAVQREVDRVRAMRTAPPPARVDGTVEPPTPFGPEDEERVASQYLDSMKNAFFKIAKGTANTVSMAVEPLARADDVFRYSALTALGRIPLSEYPSYFSAAVDGKARISGAEFNRLAFGDSMYRQLKESRVVADDWIKAIVPDRFLAGREDNGEPLLSWADVLGLGSEVFVSPFAVGSILPRTAMSATRVGRIAVKAFDAPTTALLLPVRMAAKATLSPQNPFSHYVMQALGPETVLGKKMPEFVKRFREDYDVYTGEVEAWVGERLPKIFDGKHKAVFKDETKMARIWDHLAQPWTVKLAPDEKAAVDEIVADVLEPLARKLEEAGHGVKVGKKAWDPARHKMLPFLLDVSRYPKNRMRALPERSLQQRMAIDLPLRELAKPMSHFYPLLEDRHKNVVTALGNFVERVEKKVAFERMEKVPKIVPAAGPPLPGQAQVLTRVEEWVPAGSWAKYKPKTFFGEQGQNPLLLDLDERELQWLLSKGHELTGHRAYKNEIIFGRTMERFMASLDDNVRSLAQKNRILGYLYKKPGGSPLDYPDRMDHIASAMVGHVVVATLGLNLASSIHNMSQLTNIMAHEGISPVLRGMLNFAKGGPEGKFLRDLRKEARFKSQFDQLVADPDLMQRSTTKLQSFFMAPFSATEMFVRGTAYHVALEKTLKAQGLKLSDAIAAGGSNMRWVGLGKAMKEAKHAALDTNFVYGLAGRGPLMAGPVARVAFSLQSFSIKEAEFLARTWSRDGGDFMRWVNLNGWAIDMLDKVAGVNAESWMGWGFLPPNTFGRGPQVETVTNLLRMLAARAEGDEKAFEDAVRGARGSIGEVFRAAGADVPEGVEVFVNSIGMLGVLPTPVVGIARTAKAYNEFTTGIRSEQGGATFRVVTPEEAAKSWFFTTHKAYADRQLAAMDRAVRAQVDRELDRRAKKFVRALQGRSGDEVWSTAQALGEKVPLKLPTTVGRSVLTGPMRFLTSDDTSFFPHAEMISNRVSRLIRGATVSKAITDMDQAGWVRQILWAQYSNAAFQELQHGGVIPLQGGGR